MKVEYGNREGQYFTEWRFDLLLELLGHVQDGPVRGVSEIVEVEEPKIWYDNVQDYHCLSFRARGRLIEVRLYKVFAAKIDGVDGWVGCPRNLIYEYAGYLRKEVGITPAVNYPQEAVTAPKTEAVREAAAALGIQCVDVKGATDDLGSEQVHPE